MAAGLPSAVLVEIEFTAGVWTDVGSLVKGDSIEIHVGRDSAASGIQPGTLDLDLDNADGRFTPDNPTSTHYPNFVEGKRIRVRVTKSATTYVRFVGRITSLEPSFPTGEPSQSVTHVAAVDILGDMARITLPSYLEGKAREIAATGVAFYPLTDANEHVGMFDALDQGNPLVVWDRTPGTGRIDARADDTLSDGQSYVQLFNGKGLWHTSVGLPTSIAVAGGPLYVAACVKVSSSSYGEVMTVGNLVRDSFDQLLRLRWTATGFILDSYAGGSLVGSSAAVPVADGWHYVLMLASSTGDQFTIDGGSAVASGGSFTGTPRFLSVGSDIDMSVGQLSASATALAGPIAADPTSAVIPGFDLTLVEYMTALSVAARATDLPATLSWTSTPTPKAAPAYFAGMDALSALLDLVNSNSGLVYAVPSVSVTQTVQLVNSADARPTTVALTVDAEADLAQGPTLVRDISERVSTATASSSVQSVTVIDDTVTDVGAASVEITTVLASSNDLRSIASDRIARGRDQRTRLTSLTVDLATASNDLYASFYAVTPGERLRLSGLPTTYFGVSYIDGYVEGWTERPGVNGYEVVFDLSPADAPSEARYDTGRYAFGDGVCTVTGGTAVGTTSTGTITLTWATSPTLSTAAGDYPMDFDWNGERVTVTSAPAGGTSPRTLTITARGVAPTVARSHSAGESIEPWDAARYAL